MNTPGVGDHAAGPANDTPEKSAWQKFIELEPAILRGILVAVSALLVKTLGITVVDSELVDGIIDLYVGVSALITAIWIRPSVTANARVIAFKPRPFESPRNYAAGEATVDLNDQDDINRLVQAAQSTPLRRAA